MTEKSIIQKATSAARANAAQNATAVASALNGPGASSQAKASGFKLTSPYVMIWMGLASLSLAYLALVIAKPELVAQVLGARTQQSIAAEAEQSKLAVSAALAEVEKLKSTIDELKTDLASLHTDVGSQLDRDRELIERVAALEAPQNAKATAAAAKKAAAAQAAAAAPAPAAKAQPAAAAAKKDGSLSLETGSVGEAEKPAAAPAKPAPPAAANGLNFGPAVVTPAPAVRPQANAAPTAPAAQGRTYGVQIATGPSVDSLRLSWTLLSERHGQSLGRLQPRYTMGANENGVAYDLMAGPFASPEEAQRVCQELSAKSTPCVATQYRGDAL